MGGEFRSVLTSAVAVTGVVVAAERLEQACKCYRQWQLAMSLGDRSGAEGWQTFMTVDSVEAGGAVVTAARVCRENVELTPLLT